MTVQRQRRWTVIVPSSVDIVPVNASCWGGGDCGLLCDPVRLGVDHWDPYRCQDVCTQSSEPVLHVRLVACEQRVSLIIFSRGIDSKDSCPILKVLLIYIARVIFNIYPVYTSDRARMYVFLPTFSVTKTIHTFL